MQTKAVIDDATSHLHPCCGREPEEIYGPASTILCTQCKAKITVATAPFFRDAGSQREHERWRAVSAWNQIRRQPNDAETATFSGFQQMA
ncbi:hypothetical protein ACVMH6_006283 [Rhizobium leguminosarum]